jgi:hypothetical protein
MVKRTLRQMAVSRLLHYPQMEDAHLRHIHSGTQRTQHTIPTTALSHPQRRQLNLALHQPYEQKLCQQTLPLPSVPLDSLNRALAAELIRAPLTGRRKRLRGTEAKNLASSILQPLYAKPNTSSNAASPTKVLSDEVLGISISSCLGLTSAVGIGNGGPTGGVRRVECIRFRIGGDGYESPIDDEDEDVMLQEGGAGGGGTIKETFDVSFTVAFGGLSGEWVAKGLSALADELVEEERAEKDEERGEQAWKGKFLDSQRRLWEKEEEVRCLKDRILEAVL